MERNQIIGFVLIFVILMVWSIFNKPPEIEEVVPQESEVLVETPEESTTTRQSEAVIQDSIPNEALEVLKNQFSIFAAQAAGQEEIITLENELIRISFSNKGGRIVQAELQEYYKLIDVDGEERKEKVRLFEDEKNRFNYALNIDGRLINTEDLYFTGSSRNNSVEFRLNADNGGYFLQRYTLSPDSYQIDYTIQFHGLNNDLRVENGTVDLQVDNYLDRIEQNTMFEKRYSTVYYREVDEDSDYCSCTRSDTDDRSGRKIQWVSFVNQFFNTSIMSKSTPFDGAVISTDFLSDDSEDLKLTSALLRVPYNRGFDEQVDMELFLGPNEYKMLRSYDQKLEEVIPFGRSIFGDINRIFIRPFFDWLSQYIGSKGIVIIVLIFIIKMALYPLTYKMLHSQAKMGALKPELASMKERYKDDSQKQQMETMKVYREYGVSPFGGCMPMVVQMPIWYALFRFFPASITFRQEPFLWASDLSSYDVFFHLPFTIPTFGSHLSLFTLLWAITTVIYTFYNMRHMDMSANPAMKYVQYLMPLMFFVFFNNYASGLTCYMFFSNLMNIAQTIVTKRFVFDDEKILAELKEKKISQSS